MLKIDYYVAMRHSRSWVELPLSPDHRLGGNPLAYMLEPSPTNGLRPASFVMTWLPTAVHADQLQGPLARLAAGELKEIAAPVIQSLDLECQEPWRG